MERAAAALLAQHEVAGVQPLDSRGERLESTRATSRSVVLNDLCVAGLCADWLWSVFADHGVAVGEAVVTAWQALPAPVLAFMDLRRSSSATVLPRCPVVLHRDVLAVATSAVRAVWRWVAPRFHVKHGALAAGGSAAWGLDGLLGAVGRTHIGAWVECHGTVLFELQVVAQCTVYEKALRPKRMAKRRYVRGVLRGLRTREEPAGHVTAAHVLIVTAEVGVNGNDTLVNGAVRINAELLEASTLAAAPANKLEDLEPVAESGWDAGKLKHCTAPKRMRTTAEDEAGVTARKRHLSSPAQVLRAIDSFDEIAGLRDHVLFAQYVEHRWGKATAHAKLREKAKLCCEAWGWTLGEELHEEALSRGGHPALVCKRSALRSKHKKEHRGL